MNKDYFKILKSQATDKMNHIITTIENKQNEVKLRLDEDEDLKFLDGLSAEELKPLLEILKTEQNQGINALYQGFTAVTNKIFNREDNLNTNDVKLLISFIKDEIHLLGGNTFVNIGRGNQGVTYKEIVKDVCTRIGINEKSLENIDDIKRLEDLFFKEFRQQFDQLKHKYYKENKFLSNDEIKEKLFDEYTNSILKTLLPYNLTGPAWRKTIRIVFIITELRNNIVVQS